MQSTNYSKQKAIDTFSKTFNLRCIPLSSNDVDYKLLDPNGKTIGYADIVIRIKPIRNAFPLPVFVRRVIRLLDKRIKPIVIWACEDGILYVDIRKVRAELMYDNKTNEDLIAYYEKDDAIRYIRYV